MKRSLLLFSASLILAGAGQADEKVQQLIQSGGGEFDFGKSVPGQIELTSPPAFPLLQDAKGNIIAAGASRTNGSRAVGFTHGSFLKSGAMTEQLPGGGASWRGGRSGGGCSFVEDRPKEQQEINDQWVIRLSKACGVNLYPFWATWNLPMTDLVESELEDLPVWEDHPVKRWQSD